MSRSISCRRSRAAAAPVGDLGVVPQASTRAITSSGTSGDRWSQPSGTPTSRSSCDPATVMSPQGPPGESNAAADVPRGGSRRRNLRIAAGLATVYALLLLADAALPGVGGRPRTVAAIRPHARIDNGPLWTAYTRCGAGKISDRGVSLYLDTAGDQWHSGDLRLADVACVLGVLRAPSSLLGAIAHGQQPLHWTVDADTFSTRTRGGTGSRRRGPTTVPPAST